MDFLQNTFHIKLRRVEGPATEVFSVQEPLFCPYHNRWGEPAYRFRRAFSHNPFTIHASSTSGSPVILDHAGMFFGFAKESPEVGCVFSYDGNGHLSVSVPAGQVLLIGDGGHGDDCWREYNRQVLLDQPAVRQTIPEHWTDLEYCTWVEQKRQGSGETLIQKFFGARDVLSEQFVVRMIDRIKELGLPPGKFTIDDGWFGSYAGLGDWQPDPDRFPRFRQTVDYILNEGFVPGLWMAPIWIHPQSCLARRYPEFIGDPVAPSNQDAPHNAEWNYLRPGPGLDGMLTEVFERISGLGFRKLKFDMTYARKDLMRELHKVIYRAVKAVDSDLEIEIHQPDIFFSQYGDAIRTNDVLCNECCQWKELTRDHFEVCYKSAPLKVLNLDHVGGNDPSVMEEDFLEHVSLYRGMCGVPVISLLDGCNMGKRSHDALLELAFDYKQSQRAVSDFCAVDPVEQVV